MIPFPKTGLPIKLPKFKVPSDRGPIFDPVKGIRYGPYDPFNWSGVPIKNSFSDDLFDGAPIAWLGQAFDSGYEQGAFGYFFGGADPAGIQTTVIKKVRCVATDDDPAAIYSTPPFTALLPDLHTEQISLLVGGPEFRANTGGNVNSYSDMGRGSLVTAFPSHELVTAPLPIADGSLSYTPTAASTGPIAEQFVGGEMICASLAANVGQGGGFLQFFNTDNWVPNNVATMIRNMFEDGADRFARVKWLYYFNQNNSDATLEPSFDYLMGFISDFVTPIKYFDADDSTFHSSFADEVATFYGL